MRHARGGATLDKNPYQLGDENIVSAGVDVLAIPIPQTAIPIPRTAVFARST